MRKIKDLSEPRRAVIIGGHSGLGFDTACVLREEGYDILIAGRRTQVIDQALDKLRKIGCGDNNSSAVLEGFRLDILDDECIDACVNFSKQIFGNGLDVLVNCAGVNKRAPALEVKRPEISEIIDTNAISALMLANKFFPYLSKGIRPQVINICSIFSSTTFQDRVSYSASKAALLSITKTLALEFIKNGIQVNSVSPGPIMTELNKMFLEQPVKYQEFCKNMPYGQFGDERSISSLVSYIASGENQFMVGSDFVVDGGWTI
jgi:NAD(P)-dependent dehydrogenase (short-subunit alcohol dehydrogenase family)